MINEICITIQPESPDALPVMGSLAKSQRLCLHDVLKKYPTVTNGLVSGFFSLLSVRGLAGENGYKSIDATRFRRINLLMLD